MSYTITAGGVDKTNLLVDNTFFEYIYFAATASIAEIENCMKRNIKNVWSYNIQNYEKILNYYNTYNYWGSIEPEDEAYELIENRAEALKEHHDDILWLYNRLCDYRSKRALFGVIENWLTFSMVSLDSIIERTFKQYFDLDIIKCNKDEVFVDLGAYTGDTVKNYLASYRDYKRIYCYEIAAGTFQALKRNLAAHSNTEIRQKGVADKAGTMFVSEAEPDASMHKLSAFGASEIEVVSLDEDILEPVSFIKMDIEGGEQKALLGCREHIKASHPKLAVSVYHNNEDIWKCARIIDEIDSGYKFYMRYYGGNYYPSECVLFGV